MNAIRTTVLCMLAMLTSAAQAQTITYRAPNKNGGQIVLTDKPCTDAKYDGALHAYTSARDGSHHTESCWVHQDGQVYVIWLDDHNAIGYDARGFKRHVDHGV